MSDWQMLSYLPISLVIIIFYAVQIYAKARCSVSEIVFFKYFAGYSSRIKETGFENCYSKDCVTLQTLAPLVVSGLRNDTVVYVHGWNVTGILPLT
jgi:hypothetical protein